MFITLCLNTGKKHFTFFIQVLKGPNYYKRCFLVLIPIKFPVTGKHQLVKAVKSHYFLHTAGCDKHWRVAKETQ